MRKIIFSMFVILLFACTAYPKKKVEKIPSWLNNPKSVYPESQYLSALGEGDTRHDAENMAVGNLTRIFESNISATNNTMERYQEITKNNKTDVENSLESSTNVNIQSKQTLFNIEFGESYVDKSGRTHVVAYLHRTKTARIYEEKINNNSEKIIKFIEKAQSLPVGLEKYAYTNAAVIIGEANSVLLDQLTIILPAYISMIDLNYDLTKIKEDFRKTSQEIKFMVKIDGDTDNKVKAAIEEVLNELNFTIADDNNFSVIGNLTIEPIDLQRKEKFARWELTLKVTDKEGNSIITFNKKGREGHLNQTEANARCYRQINKELNKSFKKKFIKYVDKLIK